MRYEHGDQDLAHTLLGRTVVGVDTSDGWVDLTLDDGTSLHVSAEYGQSLVLRARFPEDDA